MALLVCCAFPTGDVQRPDSVQFATCGRASIGKPAFGRGCTAAGRWEVGWGKPGGVLEES